MEPGEDFLHFSGLETYVVAMFLISLISEWDFVEDHHSNMQVYGISLTASKYTGHTVCRRQSDHTSVDDGLHDLYMLLA